MKKIKKLCDIKKSDFDKHKKEIIKLIKTPTHICKKCLRVANSKKHLCKAESF